MRVPDGDRPARQWVPLRLVRFFERDRAGGSKNDQEVHLKAVPMLDRQPVSVGNHVLAEETLALINAFNQADWTETRFRALLITSYAAQAKSSAVKSAATDVLSVLYGNARFSKKRQLSHAVYRLVAACADLVISDSEC